MNPSSGGGNSLSNISLVRQVLMPIIMSGLLNSTKLKNCNFFSLRDWKFIWNTFKAGGSDGVVFGDCLFVGVDDESLCQVSANH